MGAVAAYTRTNGIIFTTSLILTCLPVIVSALMPNCYLGKQQNAITNTGVLGEATEVPRREVVRAEGNNSFWQKLKNAYYREN